MAKKKIDISGKNTEKLRKVYEENLKIYNKNLARRYGLERRKENEKNISNTKFLKKLLKDIPVMINENEEYSLFNPCVSMEETRLKIEGISNILKICEFRIDEDWRTSESTIKLRYVDENNFHIQWEKLKNQYINLIMDRIFILQDDWKKERIKIHNKYINLINSIDINTSGNIYETTNKELEEISRFQKLLPGNKYTFESTAMYFYGRTKKWKRRSVNTEYHRINTIEILKNSPQYTFVRVEYSGYQNEIIKKEYREKKSYILSLLRDNNHKLDLNCERTKKIERLLVEIE